ncbi:MAG: hypothetical protein K6F28_10285 [Lachnospiraceae bacterium]|nr:hypothetical protein [Lachnospiraceae bacterium]
MKRKAGKIIAAMLAATMLFGTVTVGAEELEVLDGEALSVEENATGEDTASLDEMINSEASLDADEAAFEDDAETASDDDLNASVDNATGRKKISKSAAGILKKSGGRKNKSYMYNKLSKKEKKLYDKIDKEINRILYSGGKFGKEKGTSYKITKPFYVAKADHNLFEKVYDIYKLDNPQAFFITIGLSAPADAKRSKYKYYARISDDTKTPAKIKERGESIAKNLDAYAKIVRKENGDYVKAYKILEILCNRLEQGGGNYPGLLDTVYGTRNKGYKESYAVTFTALARLSGLEAYTVLGDKDNQNCGHWVRVKINKKWYNVDPYKSDVVLDWEEDGVRGFNLRYFLKSDSTMKKDGEHTVYSKYNKFYPKAKKDY